MLDWDDYRFFLAVARKPSMRAAAQYLGVSHSTVLRRLERLEDKLSCRLIDREAANVQLTQAGEDVMRGAVEIEESVQSIDRMVTGRDSSLEGIVRVSMPDIFTHPKLIPNMVSFAQRFPKLTPEIDLSYARADLSRREADLAVRLTRSAPEELVGRKLGDLSVAAYATEAYLQQYQPYIDGSHARVLAYGEPKDFEARHGLGHLEVAGFFDNVMLQLTLAKQGLGIISIPTIVGDQEPALQRCSEAIKLGQAWIVYHADLRYTSRVRVVRDFLYESLSRHFTD